MSSQVEIIGAQIREVLAHFPQLILAFLFGSVASGRGPRGLGHGVWSHIRTFGDSELPVSAAL